MCFKLVKKMGISMVWGMVFFLMQSCSTIENLSCPYIIANPHVEIGENYTYHKYAGAYMNVYNDSEKTMSAYTVSFMLYDQDGSVPFTGTNCVIAHYDQEIAPYTEEACIVPLDSFISVVPDEPYSIDFLYLKEITYSDGSKWSDPFGMYAQGEHEE